VSIVHLAQLHESGVEHGTGHMERLCLGKLRYDTIDEFNVDSKAEY